MSRRRRADERLARLLVILPWLMEREVVGLDELSRHFGVDAAELTADLELASMCGLPPYVDELIDLYIDEGEVHMGVPRLFERPLRLTTVEAFELSLAVRAALELPGVDPHGPLARGSAKLTAALEQCGLDIPSIDISLQEPPFTDVLIAAALSGECLELRYWTPRLGGEAELRIVARTVFSDLGHWYVQSLVDRGADGFGVRTLRIDRILELVPTGQYPELPEIELPAPGAWFVDDPVDHAEVRIAPSARWILERYPVRAIDDHDGDAQDGDDDAWIRVLVPVASEEWLARLLLRLGDAAEVISPAHLTTVAAEVAAAIRRGYAD